LCEAILNVKADDAKTNQKEHLAKLAKKYVVIMQYNKG
jgi:hypothetical protein